MMFFMLFLMFIYHKIELMMECTSCIILNILLVLFFLQSSPGTWNNHLQDDDLCFLVWTFDPYAMKYVLHVLLDVYKKRLN
jgi:hypothetical protein